MTKQEAEHAAQFTFGPRAECVRVSSNDRNSRFVIALGSYRLSKSDSPVPLLLGSGRDWESALDHGKTTPNGIRAIEEFSKVKELIRKVSTSETPGAFTEAVREMTIKEAQEKNLGQEVIDKINARFDAAKLKLEKSNADQS